MTSPIKVSSAKCDDSLEMIHLTELRRVAFNNDSDAFETLPLTLLPEDKRSFPAGPYSDPNAESLHDLEEALAKDGYKICSSEKRIWAYKEDLASNNPCQPLVHSGFKKLQGLSLGYDEVIGLVNIAGLEGDDWCYNDLSRGTISLTNDPTKKERSLALISDASASVYISEDKLENIADLWAHLSDVEKKYEPMSSEELVGAFTVSGVLTGVLTPVVGAYIFNPTTRAQINQFVGKTAQRAIATAKDIFNNKWWNGGSGGAGNSGGSSPTTNSHKLLTGMMMVGGAVLLVAAYLSPIPAAGPVATAAYLGLFVVNGSELESASETRGDGGA